MFLPSIEFWQGQNRGSINSNEILVVSVCSFKIDSELKKLSAHGGHSNMAYMVILARSSKMAEILERI